MVLLPSGSFTSAPWPQILASSTAEQKSVLWTRILREISPTGALTHLAINEGIPLNVRDGSSSQDGGDGLKGEEENTLRSPSGLRLLNGDFGPALPANQAPAQEDFERAFWVSTKQNGITQIWAPRYTMFSRGNIKEKARLLSDFPPAFPSNSSKTLDSKGKKVVVVDETAKGEEHTEGGQQVEGKEEEKEQTEKWAVDLYAGIGYFVFSYAKLGFRLLCWEINPWSVEGLRRGAVANGWDVVVLSPSGSGPSPHGAGAVASKIQGFEDDPQQDKHDKYDKNLAELVVGTGRSTGAISAGTDPRKRNTKNRPRIIVFLESNEFAKRRIRRLREHLGFTSGGGDAEGGDGVLDVAHINCGFLPSGDKIWEDAWRIMVATSPDLRRQSLDKQVNGWLHLHENVGVHDIDRRKAEIQGLFDGWAVATSSSRTAPGLNENEETGQVATGYAQPKTDVVAEVEHVEMVKTFAPDVWHVVFDVHVTTQGLENT